MHGVKPLNVTRCCNILANKHLCSSVFFVQRAKITVATVLQQIPTEPPAGCFPCSVDQIITNSKIVAKHCLKISMAGKPHYLKLLQALFEPITDSGSTKIMEFTFLDTCLAQDLVKVPGEVGNYF